MTIVELFDTLRSTASTNERLEILKTNMTDTVKRIFYRAYNEDKYYMNKMVVQQEAGPGTSIDDPKGWQEIEGLLDALCKREITGNEAIGVTTEILMWYPEKEQEIIIGILQKNLKVGVSKDNFQKICPVFDEWQVSLAYNIEDVKGVNPIDGTYYASRKLDGCRCTCFVSSELQDGKTVVSEPVFISRQHKTFTTLDHLKEPMKKLVEGYHLVGKLVFDGEVCILDENGDEHFDWIMKEIRRKDHTIEHPCYNIFDVVTEDEFYGRKESEIFSTRNFYLANAFHHLFQTYGPQPELKLLLQERIESQDDFDRWSQYVNDGHWEGFMLRKDAPYKSGRTKDLLKVKKFKDAEYKVVGYERGTMKYGTAEIPVVTNILIQHKGNVVSVGSGLSKEQRIAWYDDPSCIVGKTVTIQYFEETVDSKTGNLSLRFPVLKYVYENERDV